MRHPSLLFLLVCSALPLALRAQDHALSKPLAEYLKRSEANTRVLDGALLICKEAHPDLDVDAERAKLVKLAEKFKTGLAGEKDIAKQADILAKFVFEDEKFSTPKKDDEEAFLLSDVLRNKRGNCLGLSIFCLALAEETGLPLQPVPVPSRTSESGHMLVRFVDGQKTRNLDPGEHGVEHPNAYYEKEFKLTPADLKSGYVLGNSKKREVLALLLLNLGGAYMDTHRAAEAVPLLEAAIAIRPESAAAHSNLAGARLVLGNTSEAEKSYSAALRFDPKFFPARLGLADIAFRKNDPRAEKLIADLVSVEPHSIQVRTLQASLQLKRNDLDGAIKTLTAASALTGADASVWSNLAKCQVAKGDLIKGEASYRKAIEVDDKDADIHADLAKLLLALGRKDEADAELAIAKKLKSPDNPVVVIGPKQPEKAIVYPEGTTIVAFKIVADRIFVTIKLNDKVEVDAIIDTGAEVSFVNGARVKIDLPQSGAEDLHADMGGRLPVKTVSLALLNIGKFAARNLTIGRVEQGPGTKFERVEFVLGMDVLGKWRFTLDFERSELAIWPAGSKLPPAGDLIERIQAPVVSPPAGPTTRPFILATLNQKHSATFLIDTGADAPMFACFQKPADMGFSVQPTSTATLHLNENGTKLDLPIYPATFASLGVAKSSFAEVSGRVIDASTVKNSLTQQDLKFLNVIGTPFLKTLRALHVDMPGKTVYFERAK